MNMRNMLDETKALEGIEPTSFVSVHSNFWITAISIFGRHLPEKHKKDHLYLNLWSVEAAEAFKRSFNKGYSPTIIIHPLPKES